MMRRMRFRRNRTPAPTPEEAVTAFWSWWDANRTRAGELVEAGQSEQLAPELSQHVDAIDPGLGWELTPGSRSRHALVVTADGVPELRYLAQRWLLAAPPPDEIWEYVDARQPAWQPGAVLNLDGTDVNLDEILVAGDSGDRLRLDVEVYHPRMRELPQQARAQIAFLALDWLLGEDAVEQWIGAVEPVVEPPPGAEPATSLPEKVQALADEVGEDTWSILEGSVRGRRALAVARQPLPRFEDLQRIDHVSLEVPYSDQVDGLPGPGSLDALRDLEDHLVALLGDASVLAAHESTRGVRTFHLYARDGHLLADRLAPLVSGWSQGRVRVQVVRDPGWSAVSHLH